jgi:hypothetical protein
MVSLRKTRHNKKHSPRKKSGTKKKYNTHKKSQQRKATSLEKLKQEIESNILEKLQKTGFQQTVSPENKNKPKSGHALAGETWDQSEAGKQWKNEINVAQKDLDILLQQMGYDMSASGKYARELASKKRKNPEQSEQLAENVVRKIIETKENQLQQQAFKQPKPISPVKLAPQTLNTVQKSKILDTEYQTPQLPQLPQPVIGGFFDDSSDEEDQL